MEEDNGDVSSTLWDDTSANSDTENSHDEIQKKNLQKIQEATLTPPCMIALGVLLLLSKFFHIN